MDAPTPPTETVANVYERTAAEIEALQSYKPKTQAERRRCATELVRLKQLQVDLAKEVISENAAQQVAEVIGEDHIRRPPAHLNGNSNGHAPNWAQLIAATEVRCEKQIGALKEQIATTSGGGIGAGDLRALAEGLVPWVKEVLAEATAPLIERIGELEARPVLKYEGVWNATRAYDTGTFVTHGGGLWHCEDTNVGVQPGNGSSAWKLAVKRGRAER